MSIRKLKIRVLPDGRVSRKEAARYLGLSTKTLAMWATQGKGPEMRKVGGRVFYYQNVLDEFIANGD